MKMARKIIPGHFFAPETLVWRFSGDFTVFLFDIAAVKKDLQQTFLLQNLLWPAMLYPHLF